MKIIDAHFHLFPQDARHAGLAEAVGHHNSMEHLRQVYRELGMVHGVVMGNHNLDADCPTYPPELLHYCVGVNDVRDGQELERVERHLQRPQCCGVKIYAGYNKIWLSDPVYEPIYALAARYDKPVSIHMGLTANPRGHLKYSHPLTLDEVAADHPKTRFVMCHFGNPFLESASAVVEKNPNVFADLSGLLEGRFVPAEYFRSHANYVGSLRGYMECTECWDKFMYGTDWPIVNLGEYIEFVKGIVPEEHWDKVFFENANRIYGLGL